MGVFESLFDAEFGIFSFFDLGAEQGEQGDLVRDSANSLKRDVRQGVTRSNFPHASSVSG